MLAELGGFNCNARRSGSEIGLYVHLQVQPECHEELHEALSGFLHWSVPQQDIVTPALYLEFNSVRGPSRLAGEESCGRSYRVR
jgi:hypothetical protein